MWHCSGGPKWRTNSQWMPPLVGPDHDEPLSASALLRYEDGRLVTLTARGDSPPRLTLSAQCDAGTAEVDTTAGESRVALTPWNGDAERSVLHDRDLLALEAE